MLDYKTKKKIDDLRGTLVGKVSDPKSQVEQITIALIYKFMNDMDNQSISMGGKPSFFIKEYEKYNWKNLFNPRLSGHEFLDLFVDGIIKMNQNPNLPRLFRDIFKNAYLPYRDPETLRQFLTIINDFEYQHSEQLGDAYEYLLSIMSSQGDAGQFRTPRHIIDFIVELVDPKKNETILDPACGTAGFLISSYKHIIKNNTLKKVGDKLSSLEKKNIYNNFVGYDNAPEMVRLSLVNMYLHNFNNPKIFEYNTLSSEDKWNEYYDIILANPPFMSPKGGTRTHKRFSISSNRSEVLFVDYIMEHLSSSGRGAIIVPEGIMFIEQESYIQLRKLLVETYLIGIISLPGGIFKPYSGKKTTILILDKKQAKLNKKIFFSKIKNDGFELSEQRKPIEKNDLPILLDKIKNKDFSDERIIKNINKKDIINGNIQEHISEFVENYSKFKFVKLSEIAEISSGNPAPQDKKFFKEGIYPFIRTSDVGEIKIGKINKTRDYLNVTGIKKLKLFNKGTILFPKSGASTLLNHRVIMEIDAYVASHLATIKGKQGKVNDKYLFYFLQKIDSKDIVPDPSYPSLKISAIGDIEIPLPSLEIQNQIVQELESYQKIINNSKELIEINYTKIRNKIDSLWEIDRED
jgi:type I restriction enzyme M protein